MPLLLAIAPASSVCDTNRSSCAGTFYGIRTPTYKANSAGVARTPRFAPAGEAHVFVSNLALGVVWSSPAATMRVGAQSCQVVAITRGACSLPRVDGYYVFRATPTGRRMGP